MKSLAAIGVLAGALVLGGCVTSQEPLTAPVVVRPFPAKPASPPLNWEEIDRSTQRTKERVRVKEETVQPTITHEEKSGYLPMSDDDYATALSKATAEIRQANSKMSDSEVAAAARECADKEKRQYEQTYRTSNSASYEWKKSW
jgi:hypothetical protein